jgi:hypothetical protein
MSRRKRASWGALCLLALLFAPKPSLADRVIGGKVVVSKTGEVIIRYLGHTATYSNDLYLDLPPNDLGILFNNFASKVGEAKKLGVFPAGTELIFRLHVNDTGRDYYSGPASRNPDDKPHVIVDDGFSPNETAIYFEDLLETPEYPGGFNDLGFAFTNVEVGFPSPEEASPSRTETPEAPPPQEAPPAPEVQVPPPSPPEEVPLPAPETPSAPPAEEAPAEPAQPETPSPPPPPEETPPPKPAKAPEKPGDFYKSYFSEGGYRIGLGSSLSATITEFRKSDSESAELALTPSLGYFWKDNLELNGELLYSYDRVVAGGQLLRRTDYGLLVGAAYYFNPGEFVVPYFGGGLGWLHQSASGGVPQIPASIDTGDGPQAKLYAGLRFLITPTWSFDIEAGYRRAMGGLDQEVFSGSFGFSLYRR